MVRQQVEQGLDVVDDGEMSKPSFVTYVNEHRGGFEPGAAPGGSPWARSKEAVSFPEFYEASLRQAPNVAARAHRLVCTGPISYTGHTHVQTDIENLRAALAGVDVEDAFIPAISPTSFEAGTDREEAHAPGDDGRVASWRSMSEKRRSNRASR